MPQSPHRDGMGMSDSDGKASLFGNPDCLFQLLQDIRLGLRVVDKHIPGNVCIVVSMSYFSDDGSTGGTAIDENKSLLT